MFEITPNSIAMENAVPLAKEKAKYQTLSNNENGVAHVLKTYKSQMTVSLELTVI